ncbi:MAG: RluA family pseudouridine synthase [Lachnospiraceae bacterium]|nr:RluA family pseudouridine synthase [Lachnospiraceae bacterium]
MREVIINQNEAGQRLHKFLHKYMPQAPSSFFYKMLRKKNITLNGKKAEGKEMLELSDRVCFFLSEETICNFQNDKPLSDEYDMAFKTLSGISIIYEDDDVLIMDKPENILSQKAKEGDLSLNEWMVGCLLSKGVCTKEQLSTFKPSVCNRLDRNTCGLVIGAKTLRGGQYMNELLRTRKVKKFYRLLVKGRVDREEILEGFLVKDEEKNKVRLVPDADGNGAFYIRTRYYPIRHLGDKTLVEVELITGKPHQIRIHMAGIGHPILGDYKYGDRNWNDLYKKKYRISSQMLYACRLEFGTCKPPFEALSQKSFRAPVPEKFSLILKSSGNKDDIME